jgi:hypothetical protein
MGELNVQLQPDLLTSFSESKVEQLCSSPALAGLAQSHRVAKGIDKGPYINVFFTAPDLKPLWQAVRTELVRLGLQAGSIVTCTGKDGWNDYLLLHHFDPKHRTNEGSAL